MNRESLRKELEEKSDNARDIAKAVAGDEGLLSCVLEGVSSPIAVVRFKCAKILNTLSEENPEILYPHFDFFKKLLDSKNNILKWNAIDILANMTPVDSENRFGRLFQKFYGLLNEGSLVTAAHVVDNSPRIAKARPDLENRITDEILRVDTIPLPTEECRSIIAGKAIAAFGQYCCQSRNRNAMLSFARGQLNSTRPATRKKAEQFIRMMDSSTTGKSSPVATGFVPG